MKTISYLRLKLNNHRRWIAGVILLALAAGAWTGFNHLVPKVPGGLSSGKSRLGWYLSSGQWHADARTALAMANYVFIPDNQVPTPTEPATNSQVAEASPQPLPATGVIRAGAGNPS